MCTDKALSDPGVCVDSSSSSNTTPIVGSLQMCSQTGNSKPLCAFTPINHDEKTFSHAFIILDGERPTGKHRQRPAANASAPSVTKPLFKRVDSCLNAPTAGTKNSQAKNKAVSSSHFYSADKTPVEGSERASAALAALVLPQRMEVVVDVHTTQDGVVTPVIHTPVTQNSNAASNSEPNGLTTVVRGRARKRQSQSVPSTPTSGKMETVTMTTTVKKRPLKIGEGTSSLPPTGRSYSSKVTASAAKQPVGNRIVTDLGDQHLNVRRSVGSTTRSRSRSRDEARNSDNELSTSVVNKVILFSDGKSETSSKLAITALDVKSNEKKQLVRQSCGKQHSSKIEENGSGSGQVIFNPSKAEQPRKELESAAICVTISYADRKAADDLIRDSSGVSLPQQQANDKFITMRKRGSSKESLSVQSPSFVGKPDAVGGNIHFTADSDLKVSQDSKEDGDVIEMVRSSDSVDSVSAPSTSKRKSVAYEAKVVKPGSMAFFKRPQSIGEKKPLQISKLSGLASKPRERKLLAMLSSATKKDAKVKPKVKRSQAMEQLHSHVRHLLTSEDESTDSVLNLAAGSSSDPLKSVFDMSANESMTVLPQTKLSHFCERVETQKQILATMREGVTVDSPHGIMTLLGNGRRTKPRQRSSVRVSYSCQAPNMHTFTPPAQDDGSETVAITNLAGQTPFKVKPMPVEQQLTATISTSTSGTTRGESENNINHKQSLQREKMEGKKSKKRIRENEELPYVPSAEHQTDDVHQKSSHIHKEENDE